MEVGTKDLHVIHKVPSGDGPYVRAKYLQLVEKDLDASILWFWKAINANDRVESALKDMAVVLKQQNRAEEAIQAIKSFRHLCSNKSQDSLDNLLIDLYKRCGRTKEEIELLKQKLRRIYLGEAFKGKTTRKARSHGKKFQVSIKHETSRLLSNLAWAYMQQGNYIASEVVYQKAQMIDPDANKACNLSLCLMKQGRLDEARCILGNVIGRKFPGDDDDRKTMKRAEELLREIDLQFKDLFLVANDERELEDEMMEMLDMVIKEWAPFGSKRLPIFEEISQFKDQVGC